MVQPDNKRFAYLSDLAGLGTTLTDATLATMVGAGTTKAQLSAAFAKAITLDVRNYGTVDTTGATDSSAAVLAAIAAWAVGGGELAFPAGTIRIDSQIVLPHDATAQPVQMSGRWVGRGATFNGSSTAVTPARGGTILDLRYSGGGTNLAKIDTRGLGMLEITGITFTDNGTSSNPFIHTTNTTLMVHHCAFIGNPTKATTACDQDAIILGGTNLGLPVDAAYQSPFQGYGTSIRENYFSRIRRGALFQTFANSVLFNENTFWATCGSNLAGGAAIEFAPPAGAAELCVGNTVWGNLIECSGYVYAIKGDFVTNSIFMNHIWDYGPSMLAAYWFGDRGEYNTITAGQYSETKPLVIETVTLVPDRNTQLNFHQGQMTKFSRPTRFVTNDAPLNIGANGVGSVDLGSPADNRQLIFKNPAGTPLSSFTNTGRTWQAEGVGGAMNQSSGAGGSYFTLNNYGVKFADHNAGPLRVTIGGGQDQIRFGPNALTGPGIISCTGTPEGAVTAPVGSLALRTDGGASTTLYVKQSGTGATGWIAK